VGGFNISHASVMADVSSNVLKRPHAEDEEVNAQKRPRPSNGFHSSTNNGASSGNIDMEKVLAEARAVRARLEAERGGGTPNVDSPASSASPVPPPATSSAMSRLEQMKARVAAATGKVNATTQRAPAPASIYQTPAYDDDGLSRARGGLDVGLHPALLTDSSQDVRGVKGRQATQPRFTARTESPMPGPKAGKEKPPLDLSGPSPDEIRNNPYFDPNLGAKTAISKPRHPRQLIFNQKGKYIQQAAALRRQAQLEAMKKRIAERARQAGIDEDLDLEKAFLVTTPPAIEWWDEGLVNGSDYSAIDNPNNSKIDTPDSIVTIYVQHPVLLDPPQDKHVPPQKPMYLTAKEQAKLRRQRRMANLKEQQAKIRLGLEPAPPPKVKKSNLMRVLGEEAVKDPTAVEARVNREIAERRTKHEMANEARKLTKEQRHDKLSSQQEKDAEKGIHVCVFRIGNLANGRHRFKISKNAEQMSLTGLCVMHPKLNLVVVEGGAHSINAYKKLMLNRIDWTENSGPTPVQEGNREALASWLAAEDESGELKDLSLNTCILIWEGEEKARAFRKWLGARICETDAAAKDALARGKMDSFWTLAKSSKQNVA
jgi:U4/U6 small nuclear ribonucleoprotein PRP3